MTTRELATLIWLGVLIVLCLLGSDTRRSLMQVGKAFLKLKIVVPLTGYAAVIVATTWAAWKLGYWDRSLTGAVLLWFLFTGFRYFVQSTEAGKEPNFFRERILEVVRVGALYEVFLNVRTFTLWVEIVLQFVLALVVLLRAVADSDESLQHASKFFARLSAVVVAWLVLSTAVNLHDHWAETDLHEVVALFFVPVWLAAVTLPIIYVLSLAGGYGLVFVRMAFAPDGAPLSWRARLGVFRELGGRLRDIDQFAAPWTWRAGKAQNVSEARQIVRDFKDARKVAAAEAAATAQRLIDNAGLQGIDSDGRQLDEREFSETRDALRWLATCQMGWYQRQEDGGRYRADLLEILGNDFSRQGLPRDHGITMHVSTDGQAWSAYRRAVTGWIFAIGASEKPPNQWLYDGDTPPHGLPGRDKSWGRSMYETPCPNW